MQTLKFLSVTCLGAALLAPWSSHAVPDNEKQAQMREALRKQMEQATPAPAVAPAPIPAPVAQPAVVVPVQTTPVVTPVSTPEGNMNTDAERAAMRRKMEEMQGIAAPTPPPAPVAPVAPAPVPVPRPPAPVAAPVFTAPAPAPVVVPPPAPPALASKNPNAEAERTALRQKMDGMPVVVAPTPITAPWATRPSAPGAPVYTPPVTVHAGMTPPASPFSTPKQGRLDELLRRYRADEITPQEYHTQRAAIIAEH